MVKELGGEGEGGGGIYSERQRTISEKRGNREMAVCKDKIRNPHDRMSCLILIGHIN